MMHPVTRRIVFESNDFRVGHVVARPSSAECGSTPLELRRKKSRTAVTKMRKIVIAHKVQRH